MVSKIKGTRDYIDVTIDGRVVRIDGEMVLGGFVAYSDTINRWLIPPEQPISDIEKRDIIEQLIAKTKNSHMVITFE